jgi:hypothetical protein
MAQPAILISGDDLMENISGNPYEIVVKEPIDPCWSDWLNNFTIQRTDERETVLTGWIIDQTALYGLLNTLRDLNLTLLSVRRLLKE